MDIKYFDHSATTPVDKKVLEAMLPYFCDKYGNPSSIYSIGESNREIVNIYRMKMANLLGCKVNEIYFTSCGSESDNLILKGIAFANKTKGNHIITTKIEHPAILNTCKFLEMFGFRVSYLSPNSNGIIDVNELEKLITKKTILISVMFANNEIGTIQPIKEIGDLAKKYGIYFHTDSVQAVGTYNINVKEYKIDALSLSSHKFYGPKGVGAAYISDNVPFIRIQDGGHQERDKRAGTENVPGIVGMGTALELAMQNLEKNNRHIKFLRDYYVSEIKQKVPYIKINGDMEKRMPGNANISFSGVEGSRLVAELDKRGICASSGSACSAGLLNPSHVLLSIGLSNNLARGALRISFGKNNTLEETKYLIECIKEIVENLRYN